MVISKLKRKTHYCNDTLDVKCAYLSCKWYNTKKDLVRYSSGEIAALKNIMSPLCRFWEEDFFEKIMKSNSPQDKCDAERYPQTCHELFKTICYRTGAEKGSRDILGFSASVHAKESNSLSFKILLHECTVGFTSSKHYLSKRKGM